MTARKGEERRRRRIRLGVRSCARRDSLSLARAFPFSARAPRSLPPPKTRTVEQVRELRAAGDHADLGGVGDVAVGPRRLADEVQDAAALFREEVDGDAALLWARAHDGAGPEHQVVDSPLGPPIVDAGQPVGDGGQAVGPRDVDEVGELRRPGPGRGRKRRRGRRHGGRAGGAAHGAGERRRRRGAAQRDGKGSRGWAAVRARKRELDSPS
jgi:hypothetical protein